MGNKGYPAIFLFFIGGLRKLMDLQIYDEPPSENIFLHDFPLILVIK